MDKEIKLKGGFKIIAPSGKTIFIRKFKPRKRKNELTINIINIPLN